MHSPPKRDSRVLVRRPTEADAEALTSLARASRGLHAGWVTPARDAEQFGVYLARNERDDFEAFVLVRRADGALLGEVNLSQIFRGGFQSAYLGYWIGAPFAGKGFMREGLAQVLDRAFAPLRLHRLEANIQPGNVASRRLVERLGFRLEGFSPRYLKIGGRWRDHERWAILREEWRPPARR